MIIVRDGVHYVSMKQQTLTEFSLLLRSVLQYPTAVRVRGVYWGK
jgi:hypothetical protein